ncbi:hypothetical protein IGJ34_000069 [Enterococcus sp. AZ177]
MNCVVFKKRSKVFSVVFLVITFISICLSPIQLLSNEPVTVQAVEGVKKTVNLILIP